MIGAWSINVSGRLYGPFTSERMRGFHSEGRLSPTSLIAREGTADWHEARDEPEFSDLFGAHEQPIPAAAPEAMVPVGASLAKPAQISSVPIAAEVKEGGRAHFVIVLDQKGRSTNDLDQVISTLGPSHRLLPNVWILSTEQTVNGVRNRLVQSIGKSDALFVIDASRGKAAWFNFGPEADVRIRRVWQKAS
jgi:hypothetical protein